MLVHAPAKLNLCLYLGAPREDGLHELCSLFEPLALADLIEVDAGRARRSHLPRGRGREPGGAGAGRRCASAAGSTSRCGSRSRSGCRSRPGSAAAAATPPRSLRLARGRGRRPAAAGGASSAPTCPRSCARRWRWSAGAGERVEPLPEPAEHAAVLLPGGGGLSTAEVFAEADRLGLGRAAEELDELATRLREAAGAGASPLAYPELLVNDLEPAALSLRPDDRRRRWRRCAPPAPRWRILSGSGPTAVGLFPDLAAAEAAAEALDRDEAIVCAAGRARLAP